MAELSSTQAPKRRWYPDFGSSVSLTAQIFNERRRRNMDTVVIVIGPKRSGKSWNCLSLAEKFSDTFTVDNNVFFDLKPYVMWLQQSFASAGIIEEASIMASNRSWYEKQNIIFSELLTTQGFRKNFTFMNLPSLKHLDARNLPLCHYIFKTLGHGRVRCYSINTSDFTGKIFPFLYEILTIPAPTQPTIIRYEELSKAWKDEHAKKNLDILDQLDAPYVKYFSTADYLRLYKAGLMEPAEVQETLHQMGYGERQVDLMLRLQTIKKQPENEDKVWVPVKYG